MRDLIERYIEHLLVDSNVERGVLQRGLEGGGVVLEGEFEVVTLKEGWSYEVVPSVHGICQAIVLSEGGKEPPAR